MNSDKLCNAFNAKARGAALSQLMASGARVMGIDGLAGSSTAMLLAQLPPAASPYLVVANDIDEAGYLYSDLCRFTGETNTLIFPSGYKRDIKYGQIDAPSQILRTEALNRWHSTDRPMMVVTCPEALAEKVADRNVVEDNMLTLEAGGTADLTATSTRLLELGFERVDYVYEPGQFAVRGSLLDVFSFSNEMPYRIDFFGDDIDSIRLFNVETQLSSEKSDRVCISGNAVSTGGNAGISLLEFVPDDTVLVCHDPVWTLERIKAIADENISRNTILTRDGDVNAMDNVVDPELFTKRYNTLRRIEYTYGESTDKYEAVLHMHCRPQGVYHKNFDLIGESFSQFEKDNYKILILSDSEKQIARLRAIFDDRGDQIGFEPVLCTLHEGFIDDDLKVCMFTDHQIFDRFHKYNLKSDRARSGKLAFSIKELNQLEIGDYVVHEDHGIGKFGGLLRTAVNGKMQEMIKLYYLGGSMVFVSIHSLHKLAKYRGKEGVEPRLSKLGSGAWEKMKNRTKSRLKDIARELIALYAKRRQEKGFAFSPDSYLQHELEASFIYEDTPDQLKATQAVKADMESEKPMDRLVCGDVGFGKTEVAIRAAFKAATDGKQTAVLVPTTVLAFQHYNTFRDRLKDFPVRIDYLSRARKPKEVKQVLADLANGDIDIIIGTHKLIGKTVRFKDLGLLVVDEEQKFGVAVKDKLKQLKVNVDTLTMSATPIPRTLQFSLMGARDLSAITTAPPNRYPILTSLGSLDDEVIAEAINFELSRNGQVFIVSNRINELYTLQNMVNRLVPDARTVVGHGQMEPDKLEKTIIDFTNHDYDVLIATTIIESGVDMPNVNTIIIHNAHNFGLSELHQLRGRVGRSNRKAFCYLLVPPGNPLTPVARRRLQAIESFSDLGSGIQIAMQDLDIRGAGNLLGAEQSGFIADLGYETYQKILQEAVLELKTEEFASEFNEVASENNANLGEEAEFVSDCTIDTDLELMFPPTYVPQENERISLYRELDGLDTDGDIKEFESRLVDRFGAIPPMVTELIRIVPLRRCARRLGIERVTLKGGLMHTYFVGAKNAAYYQSPAFGRILEYLQSNPKRCQIRDNNGKQKFIFANVKTVSEALNILSSI
ncbi:MAG: transcription-repair coupling factor [Bacteroidales bacterium]|nr:transcription-repair coupling factor [Candidatus Sodaliphilus aphodohippi]